MNNTYEVGDLVIWKIDVHDTKHPTVGIVSEVVEASDVIDTLVVVRWGDIEDAYSLWDCQFVLKKI